MDNKMDNIYKPKNHVISWSGGKDSTATILLFHENEGKIIAPGDKVTILSVEVMFDKKNNITGHNPDTIDFIHEKKKIFESWGYIVEILHAERDFLDLFYHKLTRSPDPNRVGLTWGFVPSSSRCQVKRDCKLKPINDWYKTCNDNIVEYEGIAIDEPKRLESMHKKGSVSLLELYGFTEKDAMELCKKYDMVSPQYELMKGTRKKKTGRDGCWFCPNAKLCEHELIAKKYPDAWNKFVSMENEPNLAYPKWNVYTKETLKEHDELIREKLKLERKVNYPPLKSSGLLLNSSPD